MLSPVLEAIATIAIGKMQNLKIFEFVKPINSINQNKRRKKSI